MDSQKRPLLIGLSVKRANARVNEPTQYDPRNETTTLSSTTAPKYQHTSTTFTEQNGDPTADELTDR